MSRRARRRHSVDSYTPPRQGYASTVNQPSFRVQAPAVSLSIRSPFLNYVNTISRLSPFPHDGGPLRGARRIVGLGATRPNRGAIPFFSSSRAPKTPPIGPILIDQWLGDRIPPPAGSSICHKRRARRATLFAQNLTGKGAGSTRKHTTDSAIHCGGAS